MGATEMQVSRATVIADDVWLRYRVREDKAIGSRALLPTRNKTVTAVRGISLVAHEGEAIGLVGLNGSGKSSLLRMLAGVEPPSEGTVLTTSTPRLLGVGAALIPQLSGQENIKLGALAMGLTPEQAEGVRPGIEELAGLGDRIRLPMNTYSSGMGARLRFAISMAASPEILMIDEALATGDASFLQRTQKAMRQLLSEAGTVFLVSHAAKTIERICTRAVWLHEGRVVADGDAEGVMKEYTMFAHNLSVGYIDLANRNKETARKEFPPQFLRADETSSE